MTSARLARDSQGKSGKSPPGTGDQSWYETHWDTVGQSSPRFQSTPIHPNVWQSSSQRGCQEMSRMHALDHCICCQFHKSRRLDFFFDFGDRDAFRCCNRFFYSVLDRFHFHRYPFPRFLRKCVLLSQRQLTSLRQGLPSKSTEGTPVVGNLEVYKGCFSELLWTCLLNWTYRWHFPQSQNVMTCPYMSIKHYLFPKTSQNNHKKLALTLSILDYR